MKPKNCEGCGMSAVLYTTSTNGDPGGPVIYLCNVCSALGGPMVADLYVEAGSAVAEMLLLTHAKVSRIYDIRFDETGEE